MRYYLVEKIDEEYYFNCENKGKDIRELEQSLSGVGLQELLVRNIESDEYNVIRMYCKDGGKE